MARFATVATVGIQTATGLSRKDVRMNAGAFQHAHHIPLRALDGKTSDASPLPNIPTSRQGELMATTSCTHLLMTSFAIPSGSHQQHNI